MKGTSRRINRSSLTNRFPRPFHIPLLYRYIFNEIFQPFLISLFVFTGILFIARSLKIIDLVINKNVPVGDMLLLFAFIVPQFLEIAMPMALLLGIIMGFGRLSADSEIVVIRSAGLSLKKLALPVMAFAGFAMLTTLVISLWLRPWSTYHLDLGMFEIARTQASAGLRAGTFNDLGQMTVYAETIENKGERLNNVIIGDNRNPELNRTFLAKYGKIVSDREKRSLSLQLFDGSIPEGYGLDFTTTYFEVNNLSLPLNELVEDKESRGGKRSKEMYVSEILNTLKHFSTSNASLASSEKARAQKTEAHYRVELHKRFAIPFSCLVIALIAMALGIQPSRGGATWGGSISIGVGILLILGYYLLFALASGLADNLVVPAAPAVWLPNLLLAILALYLFQRMGTEQWLLVSQTLGRKVQWITSKFSVSS